MLRRSHVYADFGISGRSVDNQVNSRYTGFCSPQSTSSLMLPNAAETCDETKRRETIERSGARTRNMARQVYRDTMLSKEKRRTFTSDRHELEGVTMTEDVTVPERISGKMKSASSGSHCGQLTLSCRPRRTVIASSYLTVGVVRRSKGWKQDVVDNMWNHKVP